MFTVATQRSFVVPIVVSLTYAIFSERTAAAHVTAKDTGVIAFAATAMLLPLDLHDARPYLAFLAGIVSIAVRQVLIQADIITD